MLISSPSRARLNGLCSAVLVLLLGLFAASGALADTSTSATTASALLDATAGTNIEQLGQVQNAEYDWTLAIAFVLGIIGLVWMRRHIARL